MKRRFILAALVALAVTAASTPVSASCTAPSQTCSLGPNVTTSQIQIGGDGSLSATGINPAKCGITGGVIDGFMSFTFDRAAAQLTVELENETIVPINAGTITGFGFNATPDVTSVSLNSVIGSALSWTSAWDADRTDGQIDQPAMAGVLEFDILGRFNVFVGNQGFDTTDEGGDDSEIQPGDIVTFVFDVTGNLANVTACSFTQIGSLINAGQKTSLGAGRFQDCTGSVGAWVSPCLPVDLSVRLVDFDVIDVDDRSVTVRWETAAEANTVGFSVLARNARGGDWVRVTPALIPAQGNSFSGAAYFFQHNGAVNGEKLELRLEEFDINGDNTIHSITRTVVVNPVHPPISLVGPAYDESVRPDDRLLLSWRADGSSLRHQLEISADPTFPGGETMTMRVGRYGRSLSRRVMSTLSDMAEEADGAVYWRVTGLDRRRHEISSDVFVLNVAAR